MVWEKDGVTVSAFEVDHGDLIKPSFGYRIEYAGRSVLISGDTKYNERIIDQARGRRPPDPPPTTPRRRRREGSSRKRRQSSLSIRISSSPCLRKGLGDDIDADALIAATRATYGGPLVVGTDLMSFSLGESVAIEDLSGS